MTQTLSPIIVALDFPTHEMAVDFAKQLNPKQVRLKVGKELFVSSGPAIVSDLQDLGFEIFLDLKFHDIPNTVAKACIEAAKLGVWMTNIHASGGGKMIQHVMDSLNELPKRPLITAVTVLTSMDEATLATLGVHLPLDEQVSGLAQLTKVNGADGVVCSAQEAQRLKSQLGEGFLLVTPGIRLTTGSDDDQHRIMTPARALAAGADYLVIGRPITQAENPQQAVSDILASINYSH